MDHELARELKKAGFPRIHEPGRYCLKCGSWKKIKGEIYELHEAAPTLDKLIDACGPGNFMLMRNDDQWKWTCDLKNRDGKVLAVSLNYSTAFEAVARLWLIINQ